MCFSVEPSLARWIRFRITSGSALLLRVIDTYPVEIRQSCLRISCLLVRFPVWWWRKLSNSAHCYPKYLLTYLLTYSLTPWSRVLLEKLTGSAASQEIPRIFGTWRFITVLTSARHLSLSWANSMQSSQPSPTSWRSILILSSHLRLVLPSGLFPYLCTNYSW